MIQVTPAIAIEKDELQIEYIRSSGPGGQNVNKVATAAQLRFDVAHSPSLPEDVKNRLIDQAGGRVTGEGVLIIDARRFRSQEANREDAIKRLIELIRKAAYKPPVRRPTSPTQASKRRRLESKRRRSATKQMRRSAPDETE
jgi:ribosome-associated protein